MTWLAALTLLAAVLRAATIGASHAPAHPGFAENRQIALHLLAGDGYSFREFGRLDSTSVVAPLYPLLLSGLYLLLGEAGDRAHGTALALNVIAGAASVPFIWLLSRFHAGREAGLAPWIAALVFACWPTQLYAASLVQPLTIAACLVLVTLVMLRRSDRSSSPVRWIAIGMLLAGVTLLDGMLSTFAVGVIVMIGFRAGIKAALTTVLLTAVFVGPWLYRNAIVHGRIMPIESTFAAELWKGNGPGATGSDRLRVGVPLDRLTGEQYQALKATNEAGRSALFWRQATTDMAARPAAFLRLCGVRIAKTLWVDWSRPGKYFTAYAVLRAALLLAAGAGLIGTLRQRLPTAPLAWLIAAVVLSTAFTLATAKSGVYLELAEIPLAAHALATLRPHRAKT